MQRIIKQQTIASGGGSLATAIDVSGLPNGIYFLVVKNEKSMTGKKFIK
jgi:hypothetical protein